jgi:DNA polymerase-3 subunit alpha
MRRNADKQEIVPLRAWSGYSLLRGPVTVERLVQRACQLGHGPLALTDVNNLYGATVFYKQATAAGLKPIIGAELSPGDGANGGGTAARDCVVALAADETGYENLCRLITRLQLRSNPYERPSASASAAARLRGPDGRSGAIDAVWRKLGNGGENGEDPSHVSRASCPRPQRAGGTPATQDRSSFLNDLAELSAGLVLIVEEPAIAIGLRRAGLGEGGLFLGIDPATQSKSRLRRLAEFSQQARLPLVATAPAMLLEEDDHEVARLLAAIRLGTTLEGAGDCHLPSRSALMRSPGELARQLADFPQALANNAAIAERCQLALLPRRPVFPRYDCPDGLSPSAHLGELCRAGMTRRYGASPPPGAQDRLRRELAMIAGRGLSEYFLVVREIVAYARQKGLPVAGRGSGAGSLVAYLLEITNVCPLAFNIPFERFLNEQRRDFPDLDIDFCWRFRDEVIDFAFRRWGAANVAMVSMHLTFQPRSAIRETAKALGLSNDQISRLEHGQPQGERVLSDRYESLLERYGRKASPLDALLGQGVAGVSPAQRGQDARDTNSGNPDDPLPRIARLARRLMGLPHNLSVHPGGIVIGKKPIDHYVPIQPAAKGVMITQYDKDGVEDIGLVKLDLLGNRNLSTVRCAGELVRQRHGLSLDVEALPPADPATIELLRRADTVGCNQLESPAMRHLLRQMRPSTVRDVMAVLAMIRPGAASIGMKEVFVRRLRGLEKAPAGFAPVDEILRETCGVMLYEDDVMLTASAVTGCSLAQADRFRKAVQKCPDDQARLALSREFLSACAARGASADYAKNLWVQMAKFNAYSFCRAHAASYAQLAYAGAYLKAHYPLEFWAACLNNNQSMYHARVYLEQAKRQGIRFLSPCARRSQAEFALEDGAIRLGLNRIAGLGPVAVEEILQARARRQFDSLTDCLARSRVGQTEARNMILCGAFDFAGRTRPQLMMELELFLADRRGGSQDIPSSVGWDKSAAGRCPTNIKNDGGRPPSGRSLPPYDTSGTGETPVLPRQLPLLSDRPNLPPLPGDFSPLRKYGDHRRITGLSVGQHLLALYRPMLANQVNADSRDLPARLGQRVRIAGLLEAQRITPTASGNQMSFLTLDDEWGLFEVTVFPGACQADALRTYGPHIVTGIVQDNYGAIILEARSLTTAKMSREQREHREPNRS